LFKMKKKPPTKSGGECFMEWVGIRAIYTIFVIGIVIEFESILFDYLQIYT